MPWERCVQLQDCGGETVTSSASSESSAYSQSADERMTAERVEIKYLVSPEQVPFLIRELSVHLPSHRFTGEGANRLPDPHHFVTTIYFDSPSRMHYRAAIGDLEHNVKVRAKEYYDLHPSLAELATDPKQIVRYQPWLWFELKRREGARTLKRRLRLPKKRVPVLLAAGQLVPEAFSDSSDGAGTSPEEIREVTRYCESLGEPLSASSVVNYRRLSFQDRVGELRVTVDLGLSFFSPPADLWTRGYALVRNTLGAPCGGLREAVLEVKRREVSPAWLKDVLERVGEPLPFSKFVAASRAVEGEARAG